MANSMNLRFGSTPSTEWQDELNERLGAVGLAEDVKIVPVIPPPGTLGSIDPSIVTAIITGGAHIVAAVVTVLGSLWLAKRKVSDNQDTQIPVVIVVHGNEGSRTIHMDPSELLLKNLNGINQGHMLEVLENEKLILALKGVGIVREVEVK